MRERPTYPKSTCCIPGCPRWSRKFPGEWLCARHWRMIPLPRRRVLRRSWQRERQCQFGIAGDRAYLSAQRLWARAKRFVIFREAGL